jgi:hypothetical protein
MQQKRKSMKKKPENNNFSDFKNNSKIANFFSFILILVIVAFLLF